MSEADLRELMVLHARSLYDRGYSSGSSGNISVKVEDGLLITPTNSCLGRLSADRISKIDSSGKHLSGDKPSKELFLHKAMYDARPQDGAVVHLHSFYSVAVSCLPAKDPHSVIPALTPYFIMRVGDVPLIPYRPPGDSELAALVGKAADRARAVLLTNHGPVVAARDLETAVYASEELEESARLFLTLRDMNPRYLNPGEAAELRRRFVS